MPSLEPPAARDWEFSRSVAGVARLVAHGEAHGLTAAAALAGTGLSPADLATSDREVTASQELGVVRTLQRHLTGGPTTQRSAAEAGRRVGEGYHVSTFGIFGYALLASRTVLDAMNVALRYLDLSFAFALPSAEIVGRRVVISVDGASLPADVRDFLLERDASAIRTVLGELVPGTIEVTRERVDDRVLLALDAAVLDRELPQANPQTAALCEALCRDVVDQRRARTGIARQVRVLITQRLPSGAPMGRVAAELGLSERTLRRRLGEAGTSYQALLDEVRASLAAQLLDAGFPVEDVAQQLGYAEASSFIHAHRRWNGTTPRSR